MSKILIAIFISFAMILGIIIGSLATYRYLENEINRFLLTNFAIEIRRNIKLLNYIEAGDIEKANWTGQVMLEGNTAAFQGLLEETDFSDSYNAKKSYSDLLQRSDEWMEKHSVYNNKDDLRRYNKWLRSED